MLASKPRRGFWFAGHAYWAFAILVVLFAIASALQPFALLAWAWAAIFVAGLAADALSGPKLSLIEIERDEPKPFALRAEGTLRYRVRNRSKVAIEVWLVETPCALLRYAVEEVRLQVPPRSEVTAERTVLPVRRGTASLGQLYASIENPYRLWRRNFSIALAQDVKVYPDLSAVERYGALHVRNRVIESGLRRMRLRGSGTELENLREWTPGDQFRSIEWKATARRGRLMVAEYQVERSQNVMIVLDAGRLMTARAGEQRKLDYAVTAALSLASIASLASDKVGIVAFAGEILRASAPRRTGSLAALTAELHDLEPRFEESDYSRAFAYVRSHVRKRSLIVFFTDMIDPVAQSAVLAEIGTLSKRHLTLCVFMNDEAIDRAIEEEPKSALDVYATGVALELRDERRTAAAVLTRLGAGVIDVPARSLTTALIDRYLMIKQRGLL